MDDRARFRKESKKTKINKSLRIQNVGHQSREGTRHIKEDEEFLAKFEEDQTEHDKTPKITTVEQAKIYTISTSKPAGKGQRQLGCPNQASDIPMQPGLPNFARFDNPLSCESCPTKSNTHE